MKRPLVACVTPVFNEADNLAHFEQEVRRVLFAETSVDWQIIFVDDGSRDASWALICDICQRDPRFRALRLSRNFGSHLAIQAALDAVQADAVCTLAADLQDPVETVLGFVAKWRAGAKIVWGKRRARGDEGWRVFASNLFSSLIRRHAMPRGSKFTTGSFLLMDREVVEAVRRFPEQNRITFAIVAWTGFPQEVEEYDRAPRLAGKSGWSLGRMFKTMYDAFLGFSPLPAQIITGLGLFTFALCLLFSLYVIANWLQGSPVPGWTSIMVMLSFFFGLQFVILGLMGEYLARIHCEVLRRPLYFVSQKVPEDAPPG